MQLLWLRRVLKKLLPDRTVDRIRRKRATKRYLDAVSHELLERETRLDDFESRLSGERDGFYQRIVHDVLERTEVVLQELDRRIEGLSARSGQRLTALEDRMVELAEELRRLREAVEGASARDARARPDVEEPAPAVRE